MASKKSSDVWIHFDLITDNDGKKKTVCKLCSSKLAYNGNTSSMKNHLSGKHPVSLSKSNNETKTQSTLTALKTKPMSSVKWERLARKTAAMCSRDLRPINMVSGVGFLDLMADVNPQWKVPCATTVTNYVTKVYADSKVELISEMKEAGSVALTTDIWSSIANQGYITVTAHYIDTNWNLRHQVLATRHMLDRHTGQVIARDITDIAKEFGIGTIAAVVTDNAANMTLAIKNMPVYAVLHDKNVTKPADAKSLDLTDSTWLILEQIPKVLKPLKVASQRLSGEEYPTLSSVYPIINGLLVNHLSPQETDSAVITRLKKKISQSLRRRFSIDHEECDIKELLGTASFLHPRYKSLRFLKTEQRSQIVKRVTDAITATPATSENCEQPAKRIKTEPGVTQSNGIPESSIQYLLGDTYEDLTHDDKPDDEVAAYMSMPASAMDPLAWFKLHETELPILSKYAKGILCIPATSVPSERLFSAAGLTMSRNRASLNPNTLDRLLFINSHMKQREKYPKSVSPSCTVVKSEKVEVCQQQPTATNVLPAATCDPPLPQLPDIE